MVVALLCWKLLCFKSIASVWSPTSQDLMRQSAGKWEAAGNQPNVGCTRLPPVNMHHGKLTEQLSNSHLCSAFFLKLIFLYFSMDVQSTCSTSALIVVTPNDSPKPRTFFSETALRKNTTLKKN